MNVIFKRYKLIVLTFHILIYTYGVLNLTGSYGEKKSFFTMATKVKPTTVKIRKNHIRMLDSFLYKVHFSKTL